MTTDTKPDPLEWLRAEARFPSRKADGVAATETLAYVARLQAQVDALAVALRKIVDQDMSFLNGYVWSDVIKREDIQAGRDALAAAGR